VGTYSGPSDFRLISIVSDLSKTFERILYDQVLEHVNGRNLLSDFQYSFRRGCFRQSYREFKVGPLNS
jgi:hypothetical protein